MKGNKVEETWKEDIEAIILDNDIEKTEKNPRRKKTGSGTVHVNRIRKQDSFARNTVEEDTTQRQKKTSESTGAQQLQERTRKWWRSQWKS